MHAHAPYKACMHMHFYFDINSIAIILADGLTEFN